MKPKIVFLGGSSLLSINWIKCILSEWDVFLFLNKRVVNIDGTESLKFLHPIESSLQTQLEIISPKVIVNCVALTNIEVCQNKKEKAEYANVKFPSLVAKISKKIGSKLVHISSDHLFRGDNSFYSEDAVLSPQNYYAETKAKAENIVLNENKNSLVIRTNFFGWGTSYRDSFSDSIIESLRKGIQIKLFNDVYYTPILISELVRIIHLLIEKNTSGILNVTSDERVSKYEFGINICESFQLLKSLVKPISIEEMKHLVKRPKDMSLSNRKMKDLLGTTIMPIKSQIEILKKEEKNKINI